MRESVVITVPSHPKYLSVIRATTITFGKLSGIGDDKIEDIKLAIDEACANVIKHAYRGDTSKKIIVRYTISKNVFTVAIEDQGLKAQIDALQGRDLNDIRPGGLGIHFIKKVFEGFRFDDQKKKGNRLILTKYLHGNQ